MVITEPALLIRLLIGHFASDFFLQSRGMVGDKETRAWKSGSLYIHAGIYAAVVFAASAKWGQWFWLVPLLFVSHAAIDGGKALRGNRALPFLADQSAHLAVLIIAFCGLAQGAAHDLVDRFVSIWGSPRPLVVFLGYLVVLSPAGRLIAVLTDPFKRQLGEERSRGLEPAGFWIGCLERLFLLSFVLLNYPAGIPLLLGLKSLFRFGEIKEPSNRKEAEYILIGTLLSYAFALATGLIINAVLRALP